MNLLTLCDDLIAHDNPFVLNLALKAVSKQRPRSAKSGHMYTPEQTRKFEKRIRDYAKTANLSPYTCPVKCTVLVTDPIPKSYKGLTLYAAKNKLISPEVGDLDNKVKAVTDALNGIAYLDDKQISKLVAQRSYGKEHTIYVCVERAGLSRGEVEKFAKVGHEDTTRRSVGMG